MFRLSSSRVTVLLFVAFVIAGGAALAAATLILGALIVAASEGGSGPVGVIAAGALTGVLAAAVVHQISAVAPGVARILVRQHRSY